MLDKVRVTGLKCEIHFHLGDLEFVDSCQSRHKTEEFHDGKSIKVSHLSDKNSSILFSDRLKKEMLIA